MYSVETIANEIIKLGICNEIPITHLRLQKLLYFSNCWYLAIYQRVLFYNSVIAEKYGPIIKDIIPIYKDYKDKPIMDYNSLICIDKEDEKYIKILFDCYKKYSDIELSYLSHEKNSPWYRLVKEGYIGSVIDYIELMKFFRKKIKNKFLKNLN